MFIIKIVLYKIDIVIDFLFTVILKHDKEFVSAGPEYPIITEFICQRMCSLYYQPVTGSMAFVIIGFLKAVYINCNYRL